MKYLIRFSLPTGLFIWLIYKLTDRYVTVPDAIAMPMMVVSILLMMVGIFYHGWCFSKGKSPYDFKNKK